MPLEPSPGGDCLYTYDGGDILLATHAELDASCTVTLVSQHSCVVRDGHRERDRGAAVSNVPAPFNQYAQHTLT